MSKTTYVVGISIAATLACGLAGSANAQLVAHKDLTTAIAFTMAETALQTCKQQGYNVSANVVGRNGEVIVAIRGDNTGPHTLENSMKKAYTAREVFGSFCSEVKAPEGWGVAVRSVQGGEQPDRP
jgi:Haem-degrading